MSRDEGKSIFDERLRLTWREIFTMCVVIATCSTTWAVTQSRLTTIEEENKAMRVRQERIEAAFADIPVMKNDIRWIRKYFERDKSVDKE